MAPQPVEQRFHLVRQLRDIGKPKGCRAALDGVRTPEDAVELFVIGLRQIQIE